MYLGRSDVKSAFDILDDVRDYYIQDIQTGEISRITCERMNELARVGEVINYSSSSNMLIAVSNISFRTDYGNSIVMYNKNSLYIYHRGKMYFGDEQITNECTSVSILYMIHIKGNSVLYIDHLGSPNKLKLRNGVKVSREGFLRKVMLA